MSSIADELQKLNDLRQSGGLTADEYLEAKALGFDVKALRQIVRLRKKSQTERQEEESILEVYMHALGMLADGSDAAQQRVMAAE